MKAVIWILVIFLGSSRAMPAIGVHLSPRDETANRRVSCEEGVPPSPSEVNTTEILRKLRVEIVSNDLQAYIITSGNEHQGEYIPDHDRRREYVTGFSGSAGDAVVTLNSAALWTDSRYYLQATDQLDCNWELVKTGEAEAPSIQEWLTKELGSGDRISSDPKILTNREWTAFEKYFQDNDLIMKKVDINLVDEIWGVPEGRPPYISDAPFILDIQYAGETWQEKFAKVRETMAELNTDAYVVTALDEIAWVLNLRGTDIPYSPFFRAYLVIEATEATLYLPTEKNTPEVQAHLNSAGTGIDSVQIKEYNDIWAELPIISNRASKVLLPSQYSYALGVSYEIHSKIIGDKVLDYTSPILKMRDTKSDIEAQGMRNAHIRDAVALCQFLYMLETGLADGETWDELKAVEVLDNLRNAQSLSRGPSFGTISAFGPNSALPHYSPDDVTNRIIDRSSMFMLDSGGQYLDGTTDVTRSMHYGTPTEFQRQAYTSLLIGCIQLASARFPLGKTRDQLEVLLRVPLYSLGLDYGHGSTHGIGFFGGVHEAFNSTYHVNFFGSQEPGYYRDNEFGMRLENIVAVVVDSELSGNTTFLTFETVTLVPYASNLINVEMLSSKEVKWINDYHMKVQEIVGAEMEAQGLTEARDWLIANTQPLAQGETPLPSSAPGSGVRAQMAGILALIITIQGITSFYLL